MESEHNMYQLIDLTTGEPVDGTVYLTVQCAIDAQREIPNKTRIKRVVTDEWRQREAGRLTSGIYAAVPEYLAPYCAHPDHYVHISLKDPTKLAYTQSPEKGMDDVQTAVSVESYLTKFASDRLLPHMIRDLALRFVSRVHANTLVISHERSAFRFAYNDQPVKAASSNYVSCMASPASKYTKGADLHPAEAYATDEDGLAIAYTTDPDNRHVVTARALVWPQNKSGPSYHRVYALDDTYRTALTTALQERGYTYSSTLRRAPLARISLDTGRESDDDDGEFLLPYIDGDDQHIADDPNEMRFFVTTSANSDYRADDTQGWVTIGSPNKHSCDHCGDRTHEDDLRCVGSEMWCESCTDSDAFYCEYSEEMYPDSYGHVTVRVPRNRYNHAYEQTWSRNAAANNAFECEHTGQWYSNDHYNAIEVTVARDGTTETWCSEDTMDDLFYCEECDTHYHTNLHHQDNICVECHEKQVQHELEHYGVPLDNGIIPDHRQMEIAFDTAACGLHGFTPETVNTNNNA